MKVLAIIPARGGSKGIRRKNIVKLGSKPLIEYTIIEAKRAKSLDRLIVSTNNRKIAKIARNVGAEVPFLRPTKIAGDTSPIIDTIDHVIRFLRKRMNYVPDIIVLLQPTSPFRTAKMIEDSIELLKKTKADSVITVSKIKKHPYASFILSNNLLKPNRENFTKFSLRQNVPPLYYPTGAIYTFWSKNLEYNSIYGKKIKPIIIDNEKINIDIDTPFDLFVAEMIIKNKKEFRK